MVNPEEHVYTGYSYGPPEGKNTVSSVSPDFRISEETADALRGDWFPPAVDDNTNEYIYTYAVGSSDDELAAIEVIHAVLTELEDQDVRERVLNYIRDRWRSR